MTRFILFPLLLLLAFPLTAQEEIPVPETQKAIITKRTATWCPICGGSPWDEFKGLVADYQDKALVIAAHHSSSSNLHTQVAEDFINLFEPTFGQPKFYVNKEFIGNGGSSTENTIGERIATAEQASPLAQSGLEAYFDPDKNLIEVRVNTRFFRSTFGEYTQGLYLVRKAVLEDQSSRGSNVEHTNVLWKAFNDESFGAQLVSGNVDADQEFFTRYQFPVPDGLNPDNLTFASIIWERTEDGNYFFVNTNTTSSLTYTFLVNNREWTQVEIFQVNPTAGREPAWLEIDLKEPVRRADIRVFDLMGRPVQTIFQGDLTAGPQRFMIDRLPAGAYVVRLQQGTRQISQRFIRQ